MIIADMNAPSRPHGLTAWSVWLLRATALLMWGLLMASLGSIELLRERPTLIPANWHRVLGPVWFLTSVWALVIFWIRSGVPKEVEQQEAGPVLLFAGAIGFLAWQDRQPWAVALIGPICALFFWLRGKLRRQLLLILMFGWVLASIVAFRLPLTNQLRFDCVFVFGGLATAFDGVLLFFGKLRSLEESTERLSPDHP